MLCWLGTLPTMGKPKVPQYTIHILEYMKVSKDIAGSKSLRDKSIYLGKIDTILTNPGHFLILTPKLGDFLPVPTKHSMTMAS